MSTQRIPQLAPAKLLIELLQEHTDIPGLGGATATVYPDLLRLSLTASIDDAMPSLRTCAERFGGEITPAHAYAHMGRQYRTHELRTTWRDVPLVICGSAPEQDLVATLQARVAELEAAVASAVSA